MKRSAKAALLSGLLFPGIGHLYLRQRRRGWALVAIALAALAVITGIATQQALTVVDSITAGDVPLDSTSIEQAIEASSSQSDDFVANFCWVILAGCWLFGIVDSYRVGAGQDKLDLQTK
jgi:uncharacterized membrane protein YccF (DUF307 family)